MIRMNSTLPDRLLRRLDEEAASLEMSRSELLRRILDDHFNRDSPTPEQRKRWEGGL